MDMVAGMKRKLHGTGRKQTRIRVLAHVAKREKNGDENNWRPVVDSVLRNHQRQFTPGDCDDGGGGGSDSA